ncbi:hypothetical protein [Deinococcus budaensis]|uniref:Uncharacterized protein n=1 Tax=Deinococcus budaensis TaxID=1665626 RepID=A0A7W8GBY6_9DEIO|nr:hypothetical protein [Deinococcus budaensis]
MLAALTALLAACGPHLADDEERYLAQGYTRLSAHAYVRETDGGHSFAFASEGELGEAAVLTHLREKVEQARSELRQARAGGTDAADSERLERRVRLAEATFEQVLGGLGREPGRR